MNASADVPAIVDLAENLQLLDELEVSDLFSLKAALQEEPDPRFDRLRAVVVNLTGSVGS